MRLVLEAGPVAFQAVDDRSDYGRGDDDFHGTKFATVAILPPVAEVTLCGNILPSSLAAC